VRKQPRTPARIALLALLPVVVAIAVLVASGSGETPPATGAAGVVPADVLAYVHVSTDSSRPGVRRLLAVARKLPDFPLFTATIINRITQIAAGGNPAIQYGRDIRPWLGNEAALALLNTATSTAGSLVVLDVRHRAQAQALLSRAGASPAGTYRGVSLYAYRTGTELAFVRHYLVFGQDASVRDSIDVTSGHAVSLQSNPTYQRAADGEPADRVIDAYAPVAGIQRLLVPQGGLIGAIGVLLYQPALTGATISMSGESGGVKLSVRSALDPRVARRGDQQTRSFGPSLDHVIPAGSELMLDVTGLGRIASHVLSAGATGGVVRNLGPLLRRLGAALASEGVNVQGLESLFAGETAVAVGPSGRKSRSPELIVVTRTSNQGAAAAQLANLEVPFSQLFPPPSSGSGQVPQFADRAVDGITAHQLLLAPGLELDYAVFHGLIVISTSLNGIAGVAARAHSLADQPSYRLTAGMHPAQVGSLVFLDFSQLLSLAEQTGLFRGARYRALRPDLEKVRAVGLYSTRGESDSTAELFLQIQ
jgi:hypothetical protein